jgi:predicted nucleic acid-binding protein
VSFLLDTNVISEARKPRGNPSLLAWMASVRGSELYVSVLVLGEVRRGVERLRGRDRLQAEVLERWLNALRSDYRDRILPITPEIAEQWGRFNVPTTLATIDGLMAATAKVAGFTFVTRNVADVSATGVALLNPFEPRAE